MKKNYILFPLFCVCLYVLTTGYNNGAGSHSVHGTVTGCGTCHGTSATSSTNIALQLLTTSLSPVTSYVAGGSYIIRITGTQTSSSFSLARFGYQVSAVRTSSPSTNAGTMTAPSGSHVSTPAGINVVEQNSRINATSGSGGAGTTYVVEIPWTAPSSGTGSVTLRGVINAVNSNGSDDAGDKWNTGSTTVTELGAITGTASVCAGSSTTFTNATSGGTWSSGNPSVATATTASATTATIAGVSVGTATITYTVGTGFVTRVVTVTPAPTAITGTAVVCAGSTTTLSNPTGGGTWSSSATGVATVVSGTGVVTGVAAGTATISYAIGSCFATKIVTVNPSAPNTGTTTACTGTSITLSNINSGGTWSSSNTAVGTVTVSGGVVSGLSAGTTNITYSLSTGCNSVSTVTVNTSPPAIGGTLVVCPGATTTATNAVSGGAWSTTPLSGSISVGISSGVVSGFSAGSARLTYTAPGGCFVTAIVTVNPLPGLITGTTTFCANETSTLVNATSGGTWSSSNLSVATVGVASGVVTPAAASGGTAQISYTLGTGCSRFAFISVNPISAITGTTAVCQGSTTTLSSAPSGGTWTSVTPGVATIDASTGVATGVSSGTSVVSYATAAGCSSGAVVSVNPVAPITGPSNVCMESVITLSNIVSGGTWSSSNISIANVDASGVVTGVAAGIATITYTTVAGCVVTKAITVNSLPTFIGPDIVLCEGATVPFSTTSSFTLSTAAPSVASVATVTPTSVTLTGVSAGSTSLIMTFVSTGCSASKPVTVNPAPATITGSAAVCTGNTTTLSSSPAGGTWSSSNTSIATVGSASGSVSGVSAGTCTISYTISTGCVTTRVVTVTNTPAAVTVSGGGTFCGSTTITASGGTGGTIYFQGTTSGGTSTATAAGSQSVTASGTYYFRAQSAGGCWGPEGSVTVTIDPLPAAITGVASLCVSSFTSLTTTTTGGTWSTSGASVASVGSSGVVTGLSPGTATIVFTVTSTGCSTSRIVTVYPLPAAISGVSNICVGSTSILSNATPGGTWGTSNSSVALVGATSGVVSGVAPGSVTITYTLGTGCYRTHSITINPLPAPITGGDVSVCVDGTVSLSSASPGGMWSEFSSAISVDASGVVTGISAGVGTVTYTLPTGCIRTTTVTVNALPGTIAGTFSVCAGSNSTLLNITPGGTWSSSSTANALVGSSSGVVTGIATGTSVITYSLATGCLRTQIVTVNPLPGSITGTASTCVGTTTTLSSTPAGGSWTSSNTARAVVDGATGVVTGVATGTVNITYTLPTGCATITPVTVNPAPTAGTISGSTSVCTGLGVTLASTVSGGTWSSSNPAVATADASSGLVTGVVAGTSTITYTVTGACGTVFSTQEVSVTTSATAGTLTGDDALCIGTSGTISSSVLGGTWMSSNTSVASVGSSSGIMSGVAIGTTTISYTISSSCGTAIATTEVTVNAGPALSSTPVVVCVNATESLGSSTGTWSSSDVSVATIGSSSAIVTGVAEGTATMTYTETTGCTATKVITVNPLPAAIGGTLELCAGSSTTLTNASGSGSWSSSNTTVGIIGSGTGFVIALTGGNSVINYTLAATGCIRSAVLTVNPTPSSIAGATNICAGTTTTFTNTTAGGVWSSSNSSVAAIDGATGVITSGVSGTAVITYELGTGCRRTKVMTVNPIPAAIGGTLTVCESDITVLTNATPGGVWSSSDVATAIVGSAAGVVSGISAGTTTIVYTSTAGCTTSAVVTVNPRPSAITGVMEMCHGSTSTLSSSTAGGVWVSDATSIATISLSGVVTGTGPGMTNISYALPTGCATSATVTINLLPNTITGTGNVCVGNTLVASSTTLGGTWSSSASGIASVSSGGVITGSAVGVATISYTLPSSCYTTSEVTVNPLPASISGTLAVCDGNTTTLSSTTTGGTWSSGSTGIATVGVTSGVVTGMSAGTSIVTYMSSLGCITTAVTTVNPLPTAITGPVTVCEGSAITLASTPAGGSWASGMPAVATAGITTGVVSGISVGTAGISYTLPTGCATSRFITVNPLPVSGSISGPSVVCEAATIALTTSGTGGFWGITTGNVAVSVTGVVTGASEGLDTIMYSVTNVCGTAVATHPVTVNPLPVAGTITGGSDVCVGTTLSLSSSVSGGTWSSSATGNASISSIGEVTGVSAGSATMSYAVTNSCGTATATSDVIVHLHADAGSVTGADSVCQGLSIILANTAGGGSWSSANTAIATVSGSGVVVGVSPGITDIRYIVSNVCSIDTASASVYVKSTAECATSVQPVTDNVAEIRLYPNPTHGVVTIESPMVGKMTLYTIDGKAVGHYSIKSVSETVSLPTGLAAGIYMCRFEGDNGGAAVVRLVYQP